MTEQCLEFSVAIDDGVLGKHCQSKVELDTWQAVASSSKDLFGLSVLLFLQWPIETVYWLGSFDASFLINIRSSLAARMI